MLELLLTMLEGLEKDISYDVFDYEEEGKSVHITVEDCEGFDKDWQEIMRTYDVKAVEDLIDWLEKHCISQEDCYYVYYHFEDFEVCFGYSSYDI